MIKKVFVGISLTLTLIAIFTTVVFAWFTMAEYIKPNISGDSVTGYFKDGDGSPEDPYIIESPTHVYNLAWLQYIGLLNQETTDSEGNPIITQYYFKISDEIDVIDMDGVVIPPIGTRDKPFVGHFDGNGKCISNLTVSNYLADGENEFGIEKRPLSVTTIEEDVSIVGFFGVVGALDEETKAKLADDSQIENIKEKVNAVYDLFLDNLTVRTETDRSLIGLLAGYVNGSVTNVGIGESSIDIGENTTPLTADDVFNMQLTISAYSLIGKYDNLNVVWEDKPTGGSGGGSDVGGSGSGWGGSVNMLELRKRVAYITGAAGLTGSVQNYYVDAFGYKGWFSSKSQYYINYTSRSNVAYFMEGTVMPLSIDQSIFDSTEETYKPTNLLTIDYYRDNLGLNKEPVLSMNSGFLVGGGTKTNSSSTATYIQFVPEYPRGYLASYGYGVYKSLSEALVQRGSFPENDNNFVMHMLTVDVNGNTYVIQDKYNTTEGGANISGTYFSKNSSKFSFASYNSSTLNFQKYYKEDAEGNDTGVRTAFVNANAGEPLIQGISFNKSIKGSPASSSSNTMDLSVLETTTADVTLLGSERAGYELISGAINFSLFEEGISTTVLGTYRYDENYNSSNGQNSQGLYTLFHISRNDNNEITQVTIIRTIHERLNPKPGEERYVYNMSAGDAGSGYKKVFDTSTMNLLSEANALYYFEIPLNAGDYAIGATTSTADHPGAYLLYLDIGANGNRAPDGGNEGTTTVPSHKMIAVTFVDSAAIANKTTENYSVVTFEVNINEGVTAHGGLSMSFNRTSPTQLIYSQDDPSSAFTVTMVKDDAQLSVEKVQNMLIADLQKKRYFRRKDVAI